MDGLIIREARKTDLPALIEIFRRDRDGGHAESRAPAAPAVYEAAFDRIAADINSRLYVAELDDRAVGTFQLTFIPGLVNHGRIRAKIESVHVRDGMRSRGIGTEMMRAALAAARAGGAGIAELASNKRRVDAHRFYERLGFERSHEGFKIAL